MFEFYRPRECFLLYRILQLKQNQSAKIHQDLINKKLAPMRSCGKRKPMGSVCLSQSCNNMSAKVNSPAPIRMVASLDLVLLLAISELQLPGTFYI
jgi:hypothetical protein